MASIRGLSPRQFFQKHLTITWYPNKWLTDPQDMTRSCRSPLDADEEEVRNWMNNLKGNVMTDLPSQWIRDCALVNPNFPGLDSELQNRLSAEQAAENIKKSLK